jgi:hypothetical protein
MWFLHLFSFTKAGTSVPDEPCETPTLWAVMSGEDVAYCASSMRNGVKIRVTHIIYTKTYLMYVPAHQLPYYCIQNYAEYTN